MSRPGAAGSVAILAGSGALPLLISDRLRTAGREVRILAFRGFADAALRARADAVIGLLDLKEAIAWLDRWGAGSVTLAGGVTRPNATAAIEAFSLFRKREEVTRLMARGDDNILRGVLDLLEERGHRLVGVRDLAPELLAADGVHGRCRPDRSDNGAIECGLRLLASLSSFDIGQAVALRGERVLAVEGPEGTDRMLARVRRPADRVMGALRRIGADRGGVLVKAPKRGQDLRIDLPAIGPRTVVNADRAGLAGIAVAAGVTLVIDREKTIAEANRRGLFLVGVRSEAEADLADAARAML